MSEFLHIDPLTEREFEILALMVDGLNNQAIADQLYLTHGTVKWYASQIYSKLAVNSRPQVIAKTYELGLLDRPQGATATAEIPVASTQSIILPKYLTSFVGREQEIEDVIALQQNHRLITLTGSGGSGKTRLAVQVAKQLEAQYPDGVYFVALAPIRSSHLVLNTIIETLEIEDSANRSAQDLLRDFLNSKQILIVLDNFEHVMAAMPDISTLLQSTQELTMIVTSREALQAYGEVEYRVPPLQLSWARSDARSEPEYTDAMHLFAERAASVRPNFQLTPENAEAVANICQRADGLPLALELAAARMRLFTPQQLSERLEHRLQTLSGGMRDLPERQQTVRNTIDWSYNLLDADEKTIFDRLAIFRGGCNLDAIEAVCVFTHADPLTVVESLYNKSLVQLKEGADGEPRFMMLETVYEYAQEQLDQRDERDELARRHAEHYVAVAEQLESDVRGYHEAQAVDRFRADNENFRSALDWAFNGGDVVLGVRLVAVLGYLWLVTGRHLESERWYVEGLAYRDEVDPILAVRLILAGSFTAYIRSNTEVIGLVEQALAIAQEENNDELIGQALMSLGIFSIGNPDEYKQAMQRMLASIDHFQQAGNKHMLADAYNVIAELEHFAGNYDEARHYYQQGLTIIKEVGVQRRVRNGYMNLGTIAFHKSDYVAAEAYLLASLSEDPSFYDHTFQLTAMSILAATYTATDREELAVKLIGMAETELAKMGISLQPNEWVIHQVTVQTLQNLFGDLGYDRLWDEGSQMSLLEAVQLVQQDVE